MPTLIPKATTVDPGGAKPLQIDEYIGRINSGHANVSIALLRSPAGWDEPPQTPEFEEFTIVLKGMVRITHRAGKLDVRAGQAAIMHPGEWVQYSTPEGAEYLAVCLPAFTLEMAHREQPAG
jgi:quercetin dioxygenase-like cupin family protein